MFFIGYGSILAIFTRITCIIWRVCFAGTETLAYHSQSQVPGMGNAIAVMDQLPASAVENPGNGVGDRCTMTGTTILFSALHMDQFDLIQLYDVDL